ncbi:Rab5-interacting protein-domain-containing protein [Fimicolochytrium jonesii]|uniref:Rab5-interacting protein-domain-containing protein n=1 Tax=Fimicolochytrium jonesii TaxID=1396493 RepID=UPI0022FF33DB|nr:Rab5-interacting protein-domain-containing protein [Fimicolochytrium jonesii]KAI8826740.1 Rab5-interacting protein-domain-containing protein [Fimicolochytrium jonesii]
MSAPVHDPTIAITSVPRFSPVALRSNISTLQYARSSLAFLSGAAAGILGLQGWLHGFLFYAACSLIMSISLWVKSGFAPTKFFPTAEAVWTSEVAGNAFSYLLFWTLAYGLVHVYD